MIPCNCSRPVFVSQSEVTSVHRYPGPNRRERSKHSRNRPCSCDRRPRDDYSSISLEIAEFAQSLAGLLVGVGQRLVRVADRRIGIVPRTCLFIGALRRFTGPDDPSNAETGRLEVTVVDRLPPTDAVTEAVTKRFLDRETPHIETIEASELEIVALKDDPVRFSLDGERREYEAVEIGVRLQALRVCVGNEYVLGT